MIHQYKLNGYNIVMDANSGSVHSVDDVAYDIIGMYEGSTAEEITDSILSKYAEAGITEADISEVLEDIEALKKEGLLFSKDPF